MSSAALKTREDQVDRPSIEDAAKAYVDDQLASMRKHGLQMEEISAEQYNAMVAQVIQAVRS